mmetsp:Transcript_88250/g.175352  ORF Transcript_88250/g.175352 Transcript_88250/m.175352 type:complete len:305 (+) Transcript_88250:496-1410(+)
MAGVRILQALLQGPLHTILQMRRTLHRVLQCFQLRHHLGVAHAILGSKSAEPRQAQAHPGLRLFAHQSPSLWCARFVVQRSMLQLTHDVASELLLHFGAPVLPYLLRDLGLCTQPADEKLHRPPGAVSFQHSKHLTAVGQRSFQVLDRGRPHNERLGITDSAAYSLNIEIRELVSIRINVLCIRLRSSSLEVDIEAMLVFLEVEQQKLLVGKQCDVTICGYARAFGKMGTYSQASNANLCKPIATTGAVEVHAFSYTLQHTVCARIRNARLGKSPCQEQRRLASGLLSTVRSINLARQVLSCLR